MKLAVLKERRPYETRVADTPETVKKLMALGFQVVVEKGAGVASYFPDEAYKAAGATLAPTPQKTLEGAAVILKVQAPMTKKDGGEDEISLLPDKSLLLGMLSPYTKPDLIEAYNKHKVTAFPRTLPSQFPPASTARSTITEPPFIPAIISVVIRRGAGFPGIRAVEMAISDF